MLTDRIVGALTFRRSVYADVERDTSFTSTAWMIVAVIMFLQQLGANASRGFTGMIVGGIVGTIVGLIGFAIGVWVIANVGAAVFGAEVTFDELVRTLGLAFVWNVVGALGILGLIGPALACIIAPLTFIGWILALIAWFIAAQEALDLDWIRTLVTVFLGWLVIVVISFVTSFILTLLGLGSVRFGALP